MDKDAGTRYVTRTFLIVFVVNIAIFALSAILSPLLPAAFEIVDFFSELSVLAFVLIWTRFLKHIHDPADRLVISVGVGLFAIGALADLLDEFGLRLAIRAAVENLSFVSGFLMVSLGLRNWMRFNYRKQLEIVERNEYLAQHDSLTGLRNREALMSFFHSGMNRREGDQGVMAVVFIDLDRFKTINDSLGHQAGDELLRLCARRIRENLRRSDLCFRVGGDEFVIVSTELSREEDAFQICAKLRGALSSEFLVRGSHLEVNGSFGIALYPRDGEEIGVLLKHADLAMYAAKKTPQHIRFFSEELSRTALNRAEIESDLYSALDNRELSLAYQPIVDQRGGAVIPEALARWTHPGKGMIPPDSFIPIAEETGLISPIGTYLFERLLEDFTAQFEPQNPDLLISVNVSAVQFQDPDFPRIIIDLLEQAGVSGSSILLEITESVIIQDIEDFNHRIQSLLAAGNRFAMDDFGSGYSSLNYLGRLAVDYVKFDRHLIERVDDDGVDGRIVSGMVDIVTDIGKRVIIEGVENEAQHSRYEGRDDVLFQGFLYARPASADAVVRWMQEVKNRG